MRYLTRGQAMTTLKQLLNCSLYDEEGKEKGRINEALYDKSSKKCLMSIDNAVYSADKIEYSDIGITGNNLQPLSGVYPAILGKTVYESTGKILGTISDAEVNKSANIVKLILEDGRQFSRGRIAAIDDIVLIKAPKPAVKKQKRGEQEQETKIVSVTAAPKEIRTTRRRYGDFNFLIGKTADKNITNFYGEIMIHTGKTVTQEVLRQAKISGKLIELCLHVK